MNSHHRRWRLGGPHASAPSVRALRFEPLEGRRVLAPITVTTLDDSVDFNDGQTSLREAIFAANTVPGPDEIRFDPALFAAGPATILLTHGELSITDSLTLTGPGAELLTIDASGNDPTPELNNGDGSRVLQITAMAASTYVLSGLTLTGGDVAENGGAISASAAASALTLLDAVIRDNHARHGGGVYLLGGALEVRSGAIRDNTTQENGGGVFLQRIFDLVNNQAAQFTNVEIIGNHAGSGTHGFGGGIYDTGNNSNSKMPMRLEIVSSIISGNTARRDGGGVYARNLPVTFRQTAIFENSAGIPSTLPGSGGGVFAKRAVLEMLDCHIYDNQASSDGGGIYDTTIPSGAERLVDCVITGNSARGRGGGVYGAIAMRNCLVAGNRAGRPNTSNSGGGGIWGTGLVENCTISANNAVGFGGGLVFAGKILNSTVVGNTTDGCGGGAFMKLSSGQTSTAQIEGSTFAGNTAALGGGGIYTAVPAVISGCKLEANFAGSSPQSAASGGAIYASAFDVRVEDSLISGNQSTGYGGGLYGRGRMLIKDSTFVRNTARDGGGGIFGRHFLEIDRSVIAEN